MCVCLGGFCRADPECERYNTIKLADFGLARIMLDDTLKTMSPSPARNLNSKPYALAS